MVWGGGTFLGLYKKNCIFDSVFQNLNKICNQMRVYGGLWHKYYAHYDHVNNQSYL